VPGLDSNRQHDAEGPSEWHTLAIRKSLDEQPQTDPTRIRKPGQSGIEGGSDMSRDSERNNDGKRPDLKHRSVLFPIILIMVGALLLLQNVGLLPSNFWQNIWRLWPLILVLVGLEIVFRGRLSGGVIAAFLGIGVLAILVFMAFGYSTSWTERGPIDTGPLRIANVLSASGNVITEERRFTDFDEVEVSGNLDVDIVRSDWYSANVTADDNLVQHVIISQQGKKLKVLVDAITINSNPTMKVRITMPDLSRLSLNASARATVQDFEASDEFRATLDSASSLTANVNVDSLRLQVSSASKATLTGSANSTRLSISGASKVDMSGFAVKEADANISNASNATIMVSDQLDADVTSASTLTYSGNPTLGHTQSSGGSTIRRR
jgi:hypothetical protein